MVEKKIKSFLFVALTSFVILFLLIVVKSILYSNHNYLDLFIEPGDPDIFNIIVSAIIGGLAGIVSISAFYIAKNMNDSVEAGEKLKEEIKRTTEESRKMLNESKKARNQADFLLDGVLNAIMGVSEVNKIENEFIKKSITSSGGLLSSSWSGATPLQKFRNNEFEILHKHLWANVIDTYSIEESYDIFKKEMATNAKNYLYLILSTISTLLQWRKEKINSTENKNIIYPKIHYFVCTSVPPDYYFNFPHKVNEKLFFYSHKRILTFTIAMEALIHTFSENNNCALEVSRVVLSPESEESEKESNIKANKYYWPEFKEDSIYKNIIGRIKNKYILNLTIPNLTDYFKKIDSAIASSSFGNAPGEIDQPAFNPFVIMADSKDKLFKFINEKIYEEIFEKYKEDNKKYITTLKERLNDRKDQLHSHLYDKIYDTLVKIELESNRCINKEFNKFNPLEFFNNFHKLESYFIRILDKEVEVEILDKLLNNMMYLWQFEWFFKKGNKMLNDILTVSDHWHKNLHSNENVYYTDPKIILDDKSHADKIWPNFALFGIEEKKDDIKWLFNLSAKTDPYWNTSLVRVGFCNPEGVDPYTSMRNKLISNRINK